MDVKYRLPTNVFDIRNPLFRSSPCSPPRPRPLPPFSLTAMRPCILAATTQKKAARQNSLFRLEDGHLVSRSRKSQARKRKPQTANRKPQAVPRSKAHIFEIWEIQQRRSEWLQSSCFEVDVQTNMSWHPCSLACALCWLRSAAGLRYFPHTLAKTCPALSTVVPHFRCKRQSAFRD